MFRIIPLPASVQSIDEEMFEIGDRLRLIVTDPELVPFAERFAA